MICFFFLRLKSPFSGSCASVSKWRSGSTMEKSGYQKKVSTNYEDFCTPFYPRGSVECRSDELFKSVFTEVSL